ncbi:MAG: FAD-binding protein [Candidatus Aureabacteria bacterium]|nr:FAD-binding protein [Candidatus Auribacterota bacterium]
MYKVVIIGSGGAGMTAAIEASKNIDNILLLTKSGLGFSNTAMAQGGIAASICEPDNPEVHYEDTMKCGHFDNVPALVRVLTGSSMEVVRWLEEQGLNFDRDKTGRYMFKPSIGSTFPRLLSCGDNIGARIVTVLAEKVRGSGVTVKENHRVLDIKRRKKVFQVYCEANGRIVIECERILLSSGGSCYKIAAQKKLITSNCSDATGEVMEMAVKLGAKTAERDSLQYHPMGYVLPLSLRGRPVPESLLSLGAVLSDREGPIDIEKVGRRSDLSAYMFKRHDENKAYRVGEAGAFKLDISPVLEKYGKDFLKKSFPGLASVAKTQGMDLDKDPFFVFPTLHYQNGGIVIDGNAWTGVEGMYAAGEITGGVHGSNRLMGNSLLDVICFGRIAGIAAARG